MAKLEKDGHVVKTWTQRCQIKLKYMVILKNLIRYYFKLFPDYVDINKLRAEESTLESIFSKNIYCTGEQVWYSVFYTQNDT